jgi:Icc-related predicted phosphoesterase
MLTVVMISDTHGHHRDLWIPRGDILLFAGDFSNIGLKQPNLCADFNAWAKTLDFKHKILICGNHELGFDMYPEDGKEILSSWTVLDGSGVTVEGIKFWGEPRTPSFHNWAYQCPRHKTYEQLWATVPDDTDVLLTHGPPLGILDRTEGGENIGDEGLTQRIMELNLLHVVCGHNHKGGGKSVQCGGTKIWNAAMVDERTKLVKNRKIQTFEISKR